MSNYRVFHTPLFDEQFDSLTRIEQERIDKLEQQLSEKGGQVGKPLGYWFFREKKMNGNRLYFLVYEEWRALLLITIEGKKSQPETIEKIRQNLPHYKEYIWSRLKETNSI